MSSAPLAVRLNRGRYGWDCVDAYLGLSLRSSGGSFWQRTTKEEGGLAVSDGEEMVLRDSGLNTLLAPGKLLRCIKLDGEKMHVREKLEMRYAFQGKW